MFTPKLINNAKTATLFSGIPPSVLKHAAHLINSHGYRFYVVNQSRGHWYGKAKVITIPSWVFDSKSIESTHPGANQLGYRIWYISHELAHAYHWINQRCAGTPHGKEFLNELKTICPTEHILYELGYKPRSANHLVTGLLGF